MYDKEVRFEDISNDEMRIYVLEDCKEIYIGNLHINSGYYGEESISFTTTELKVQIGVIGIYDFYK